MSSLVVRTLSAQTCEFISRAFAAGGRILPIGLYQPVWQVFEREGKGAFTFRFSLAPKTPFPLPFEKPATQDRAALERTFIWGRFQRLSTLQKLSFSQVDPTSPIDKI